jgi:hypothetical protein
MAVYKNAYDDSPRFHEAVVRTWSHDYGGPEGLAQFATVWDEGRNGFFDCWVNSGGNMWGGVAFVDASEAVLSRWRALPENERTRSHRTASPFAAIFSTGGTADGARDSTLLGWSRTREKPRERSTARRTGATPTGPRARRPTHGRFYSGVRGPCRPTGTACLPRAWPR